MIRGAALALAALALAGCSTTPTPEAVGNRTCTAFFREAARAGSAARMDRGEALSAVRYETSRTQPPPLIADAITGLQRTIDAPDQTWTLAADALAVACKANGWDPRKP